MRYIAIDENNNLELAQMAEPICQTDEVLIKVKTIGINRADILQRQGKYPPPVGESNVLGIEVCGDIIECGSDVKQWQLGQRVFCLVAGGGYAEVVKVKAAHLMLLPEALSYEQGAAIAEVFLTAYQSLFMIGALTANDNVLIHAGASGVGTAAIQLAKAQHCYVVTTVSTPEKARACLKIGADQALIYSQQCFAAWSKQNLPQGFKVIVDVVGGEYLNRDIACAGLDANIVILSMLAGRFTQPIDLAKLLKKRVTISASTLRNRSEQYKTKLINRFTKAFYQDIANKSIAALIDSVYSWQDMTDAHQHMQNNHNIGKIIACVD